MLTQIIPSEAVPRSAASHIANQSTVGVDSPAGETGKADRGTTADAAPVTSPLIVLRDYFLRVARGGRP